MAQPIIRTNELTACSAGQEAEAVEQAQQAHAGGRGHHPDRQGVERAIAVRALGPGQLAPEEPGAEHAQGHAQHAADQVQQQRKAQDLLEASAGRSPAQGRCRR
jgi:hypothetical protein